MVLDTDEVMKAVWDSHDKDMPEAGDAMDDVDDVIDGAEYVEDDVR